MTERIEIGCGGVRAVIASRGAELLAWHAGGRDLIWSTDPAWWGRAAPILFPIVGWAKDGRIRVDGVERPMGVHGFAAASRFTIEDYSASSCRLALIDDDETLAVYPFRFRLAITYRISETGLDIAFEVDNRGGRDIPYALGFHPGFRWPLTGGSRESHFIEFEHAEAPDVPVIAPGGLFSSDKRPVPLSGRRLGLDDQVFAAEALCFLDARSTWLRFGDGQGAGVTLAADGFPHFALWSKPGAPFLCMEAWTGHGDPVGFAGELADKPSMLRLPAGATGRHGIALSVTT